MEHRPNRRGGTRTAAHRPRPHHIITPRDQPLARKGSLAGSRVHNLQWSARMLANTSALSVPAGTWTRLGLPIFLHHQSFGSHFWVANTAAPRRSYPFRTSAG